MTKKIGGRKKELKVLIIIMKSREKVKKKKKRMSGAEHIAESIQDWKNSMKDSMDGRSSSLQSIFGDKPSCSIHDVMNDLRKLPGIEHGSNMYLFARSLLEKWVKKEMYVEQGTPEDKLCWIHH